jgi:hypothetical protein
MIVLLKLYIFVFSDVAFSPWSDYGMCSACPGAGKRSRFRTCNWPSVPAGGSTVVQCTKLDGTLVNPGTIEVNKIACSEPCSMGNEIFYHNYYMESHHALWVMNHLVTVD